MKTNDEIIKTLNDLRNREGISISELARRVDMAKSSVSRYFNGTREFPLNYVDKFASALHTTPESLIGVSPVDSFKVKKLNVHSYPLGGNVWIR
ncbi:helix-turn-helix domain-containing protein, partial [Lacticaseibacillus paracasei]|uniref:helix-turn-helix domain-containing protein n=1 Tax=Lacticaseibacillus paracasei TaxID=1597 RepID=UPI0019500824